MDLSRSSRGVGWANGYCHIAMNIFKGADSGYSHMVSGYLNGLVNSALMTRMLPVASNPMIMIP